MTYSKASVGVQKEGMSPPHIKQMSWAAWHSVEIKDGSMVIADIGGGRGEWIRQLVGNFKCGYLLDYSPPTVVELPSEVIPLQVNLNGVWPLESAIIDFAFALEVIEHLENPRHFFRELKRILAPGGWAFVSTPNNHSVASKLTFLVRGQHRLFQEACYPAHITPLLHCDFERLADEVGLKINRVMWTNYDTLPRLHWRMPWGGKLFSDSVGILFQNSAL